MRLNPKYLLLGLSLTLVGASPAREPSFPGWAQLPGEFVAQAAPALAAAEDGRLSLEAAGRRFEFGEGHVAISAGDASWSYRFQGSQGGIRALSVSSMPEQRGPGSLEYTHGAGIVERYIVRSRGVEQQFVLPGPYAGGDTLLRGSVATDLVPDKTSSFEGIAFRRGDDAVLFYGAAKAVDATGRTALLEERWSDGELMIVVPCPFLAAARFPVLVDPYIGGPSAVDFSVDLAQNPAVASTGDPAFKALAVWSTNATSPQSIRGKIIDPRGNPIIGPISVVDEFSGAGVTYTKPRVAWSSFGGIWVVAAEGHGAGAANPNFIQVNKVDASGTKTTGTLLAAVNCCNLEADVDVACNNSGLCLITWLVDRDANGTLDSVKGVFYTPATNTFGSIFAIFDGSLTRSHSRVASNGTDFYEVNAVGGNAIEGWSVTSGGSVVHVNPSQTGTAEEANPDVSFNSSLAKYLVAWDTGSGNTIRASALSSATPPVPSGNDAEVIPFALNPQITSQDYRGWSAVVFLSPGGLQAATMLVRPNLSFTSLVGVDSSPGGVPSADVAHFFRGLSVVIWEYTFSMTDHDIHAREFRTPATEYADFDNDGWASGFVWRPGTNAYFYYTNDLTTGSPAATSVQFGTTGDIPVRTDFFGSGLPDLSVFRPSTGYWYLDTNRNGTVDVSGQFGAPGDIPVPGDYDGDGLTDLAVFRPSNGTWYIRFTASGTSVSVQFGTSGDIPVPADYNGDLSTDIAVWRPSNGFWYVDTNRNGTVDIQAQFGTAGDIPVPGDYGPSNVFNAPDGLADFAVFRPSTGTWYVSRNRNGVVDLAVQFGTSGDIPVGGVYDADPSIQSPFAVFRPSNGTWYVDWDNNGTVDISSQFGAAGDFPMQQPSGQYRH
jgi:hypothetical protein